MDYDSYEEYEEAQEQKEQVKRVPAKKGKGGDVAPAPEPIIYQDAVRSFAGQHEAVPYWAKADVEYLTLGDLRNRFAAVVPFGVPDAMPIILDFLANQGFTMQHVPGFSEPVMCIVRREGKQQEEEEDRYLSL